MKVFYSPKQVVVNNESFSPSAGKPLLVIASWRALGLPLEIVEPTPCTPGDIGLAHDSEYVRKVLGCKINNGFSNRMPEIAASLPWTNGSFVSAALHAYNHNETCASPTSGFHHAEYDKGMGFCTFNGLMIAVAKLRFAGARKIGILDLDMHYGNGTDDIITRLNTRDIVHYTFGAFSSNLFNGALIINPSNGEDWLENALPAALERMCECDVILFQAGADPHQNDPYGGSLTTDQMRRRDLKVFKAAKAMDIPVAWNLAGGYQSNIRDVLDIHDNTYKAYYEVQ